MRALLWGFASLWLLSGAAFAQAGGAGTPSGNEEVEAGDTQEVDRDAQGPLRERIPPVSGYLFLKRGRFELSPSFGLSVKDPFFSKYLLGGSLTYHLTENFGISVRGGYALLTPSGAINLCEATCRPPTLAELDGEATGQINVLGGAEVLWAPIYGKISLLAEQFLHFDMYAIGGATAVQYRAPAATTGSVPELTFGGNIGVGMRVFLNRWFTTRLEVRDILYMERTQLLGTRLQQQFVVELGVSIFFPLTFSES